MVDTIMMENPRRFELINGRRADLWIVRERQIGKFISAHKLKPVSRVSLGVSKEATSVKMIDINNITGIQGGRKVAHLHYKGELYLLKSKQWRDFSGVVVKDLSERLAASKQVSFDELVNISESVGSIIR